MTAQTSLDYFELEQFYNRWLADMREDQLDDGQIPFVVPNFRSYETWSAKIGSLSSSAWGDVAVQLPWLLYMHYGDMRVLRENWTMMTRWMDFVEADAARSVAPEEGNWSNHPRIWWANRFHLGDWLTPGQTVLTKDLTYDGTNSRITRLLVPTMYFAQSAAIMAKAARVLGDASSEHRYSKLAAEVRTAFNATFVRTPGLLEVDLQGMYVLALAFNLVPENERELYASRLVQLIEENTLHLDTGFLSTQYVLTVLHEQGHGDLAYKLLLQKSAPSWLAQLDHGATTFGEMWETVLRPDGPLARVSNCQGGLATVGHWFFAGILGVTPLEPGFSHVQIRPAITQALKYAMGEVATPCGPIRVRWDRDHRVELTVTIPAGITAEVRLGNGSHELGQGTHNIVLNTSEAAASR